MNKLNQLPRLPTFYSKEVGGSRAESNRNELFTEIVSRFRRSSFRSMERTLKIKFCAQSGTSASKNQDDVVALRPALPLPNTMSLLVLTRIKRSFCVHRVSKKSQCLASPYKNRNFTVSLNLFKEVH